MQLKKKLGRRDTRSRGSQNRDLGLKEEGGRQNSLGGRELGREQHNKGELERRQATNTLHLDIERKATEGKYAYGEEYKIKRMKEQEGKGREEKKKMGRKKEGIWGTREPEQRTF